MKLIDLPLWQVVVILLCAWVVSGCGTVPTPEARIETRIVPVGIRVACVPKDTPPAPKSYPDDELPAGADKAPERYQRRAAGNEARKARLALIEPIIEVCR